MISRAVRLPASLLLLYVGAVFGKPPASPVATIRSAPERPIIDVRGDNQFLNFDMVISNTSNLTLRISQIDLSVYDSARGLALRKFAQHRCLCPQHCRDRQTCLRGRRNPRRVQSVF